MSDSKHGKYVPRRIPLSELLILLGFVLLVSAAVVTVVVPEFTHEPEAKPGGSELASGKAPTQSKKR